MAINLVDMAKGYLGRAIMEKVAGSLGGSTEQTESAIGAAIPSILGGLIGKASTKEGAEALAFELDKGDGGFLDNIGDAISGDGLGQLAGAGSGVLGSLLGDGKLGGILDAIGKISGMGRSGSGSIIGLVGSLIMGVLAKQKRSQGFDVNGLMGMLDSQKSNVAASLPEGMGDILGLGDLSQWSVPALGGVAGAVSDAVSGAVSDATGAAEGAVSGAVGAVGDVVGGVADAATGAVEGAVGAASDAVSGVADAATGAVEDAIGAASDAVSGVAGAASGAVGGAADAGKAAVGAASDAGKAAVGAAGDAGKAAVGAVGNAGKAAGGGLSKWLIPVLLLIGLGFLLVKLFGGKELKVPELPEMPAIEIPEIPGLPAGMKDQVGSLFGEAGKTFEGITDEASAKAAIPGIEGLTSKFGALGTGLGDAAKGPVGKLIGAFLPTLTEQIEKVKAIPGVGAILGTAIDGLMEKVSALIPA